MQWRDNVLAGAGAVALHAALILLIVGGYRWPSERERVPVQTTLKASIVDDSAFRRASESIVDQAPTPVAPPEEPDPAIERARELEREQAARAAQRAEAERKRQEETERIRARAEEERQRLAEQARLREEAAARAADEERQRREEEERLRREEADRKAREEAEREAREEAERKAREEAERKAREEAERKEREAAERRAREEAERQRAEAARQAELERQLRDALLAEEERAGAIDAGLLDQYVVLIQQKVERNWNRPPGVAPGIVCQVTARQTRNGEVLSVRVESCAGGDALVRSIEQAVLKASPLPPPPDPSLFDPNLRFPFKTEE